MLNFRYSFLRGFPLTKHTKAETGLVPCKLELSKASILVGFFFINKAFLNDKITIFGDGSTSRDFTFVEDIIQANLRSAISHDSDGYILNVAYGKRVTLNELVKKIIEITDSKSEIEYTDFRKGDVLHSLADLSATKKLISYKPKFNLSLGLKKAIEFYRINLVL